MAVAAVARQGAEEADKTRIRARIEHVGSEYRREVTSGTCELCIAEWTARIRDIAVDARRLAAAHDEAPTSCRRGRAQNWRGRGSVTRTGRRRGNGIAARRYSQATPSLSRSKRGL